MEIVIKIPDEAYELLKSKPTLDNMAESIIANGTPLPKGHGDLIDRDKLFPQIHGVKSILAVIDAHTIIEADKENKRSSDNLPSCNNCVHNGERASTGNCIKCSGFDRYERSGR